MVYLLQGNPKGKTGQIISEIDYFISLHKDISPAMFISYDRTAFYGKEDEMLRITFDENVLWRETDLSLSKGIYGNSLLNSDSVIMEIKTRGAIPLWLTHLLAENCIYKQSFSKYGNAYHTTLNHDFRRYISA